MLEEEIRTKAKEYEATNKADIEKAWEKLKRFLKAYPFRDRSDDIDSLKPHEIYKPGDKQTFLYWIEFKLRDGVHPC